MAGLWPQRAEGPPGQVACALRTRLGRSLLAALLAGAGPAGAEGADGAEASHLVFTGMCDASAAVPLSDRLFAVADDEDGILRIYDADRGGAPLRAFDPAAAFETPQREKRRKRGEASKKRSRAPETDIEAATRVGELALWLTSHGRKRSGKRQVSRLHLFATTAPGGGEELRLVGQSFDRLLEDLLADPRYAGFELAAAAELAPKEPGGLNIEGLVARPEGGAWIGLRSPTPEGRALLVALLDPLALVLGAEHAAFGPPVLLDLDRLGVRDLARWRGAYLVIGGEPGAGSGSRLYRWDGRGDPVRVAGAPLRGLQPEALFASDSRERVLVLSDDGAVRRGGIECKRLPDPARKRFRGVWVDPTR